MSEEAKVVVESPARNETTLSDGEKNQVVTASVSGTETKEDAKKETSPYEAELARLNALVQEKSGAIREERERRKKAEALLKSKTEISESPVEDTETKDVLARQLEEVLKKQELLEAKLNFNAINDEINRATSDPKEREAIKAHLEHSIKSTGDIAQDVANARLLANRHVLFEAGKKEGLEAKKEEVLAGFSAAASSGGKEANKKQDPVAVELLRKLDPTGKALKYL